MAGRRRLPGEPPKCETKLLGANAHAQSSMPPATAATASHAARRVEGAADSASLSPGSRAGAR